MRVIALLLATVVTATGLASWKPARAQETAKQAPPVQLKAATFRPALSEEPDLPPGLTIAGYAVGQRGYYIVQAASPIDAAWKASVTQTGAELLGYIPDFAFKVRMTPAESVAVEALDSVAWVGLFHPAYKIDPEVARDDVNLFRVHAEDGADLGLTTAAVQASGAQIIKREGGSLVVSADSEQLDAIAHVVDVAWIENHTFMEKHNDEGGGVILGGDAATTAGFDGSTQTVAVADTGLGDGTAIGGHPDISGSRVAAVTDWSTADAALCYRVEADGSQDVDSGHGTHTAVSAVGSGGSGGVGRGSAPGAGLVFQAVEEYLDFYGLCNANPDGYYLIGLPSDLSDLYQEAYDLGARIHSNSWGSDAAGDYTFDSARTDAFIWDNPDMTITFSAGNDGADSAPADGVVDDDSIGSPATAKNVITVGASEGARPDNFPCDASLTYPSHDAYQSGTCSGMGGLNTLGTAGPRWGFTTSPLDTDPAAGNPHQMAPFSSRGPTDDGRIKPDVVAPGTWILSGYSSLYQEGYGDTVNPQTGNYQWDGWGIPFNESYKYMGGTSMSNPLVAGGAAVVRDFYAKTESHSASAALVKATLINSAVDLLDENNDGADDNDFPIPNIHEGWGRVDLAAATDGSHRFVDEATGLSTGESLSYPIAVDSSESPMKVSLVWSDFASTETAAVNLVNDLDLEVNAPDGTTVYRGNVFLGGWSPSGGSADRINNVENVYVQMPSPGTWTVTVTAFNVPFGPQPFALVIDGAAGPVTSFHIGNSLTWDLEPVGLEALAAERGYRHDTGYHIRCGSTLEGIWANPTDTCVLPEPEFGFFTEALADHAWDAVMVQPYPGASSTLLDDESTVLNMIAMARDNPASQATRFYVYTGWPNLSTFGNWAASAIDDDATPTVHAREYFEHLIRRVRLQTEADVFIVPVGDVLFELDQR
ncbi:MAG: S8 family serine peptidase, partial [Acidimicrobiia bacterium]|nr:S8 family serine peptidase [Acidimicrobiia bacterium]